MNNQFERAEQQLEEQLNQGEISNAEFNKELRHMQESYSAEAEESALNAYNDEMGRW